MGLNPNLLRSLPGVLVTLAFGTAAAGGFPEGNPDSCMEGPLAQFGQYIGNWDIEDASLKQDGSGWEPGQGARWNFVCVGNGTAVQDFWLPKGGEVGTNLRTYNAETESWDIAWTMKPMPGFAHINAKQDDAGNIVMKYVAPVPSPLRRITFFPATKDGWKWKLEFSTDGGENWREVYRIKATPSS